MASTQNVSNDYVEVDLSIDTKRRFPAKNERGMLVFLEGADYKTFSKVKVPVSVAYSKELLYEYVSEVILNYGGDIIDLDRVNIWDAGKGEFRFPY